MEDDIKSGENGLEDGLVKEDGSKQSGRDKVDKEIGEFQCLLNNWKMKQNIQKVSLSNRGRQEDNLTVLSFQLKV